MSTLFVSIRLDEATMARVDALVPQFSSEWRRATRSDVLRALIVVALSRYEREVASPRLRPRPRGVPRGEEAARAGVRARRSDADAASRSAPSAAKETPASRKQKRAKKGERPSKGKGKGKGKG